MFWQKVEPIYRTYNKKTIAWQEQLDLTSTEFIVPQDTIIQVWQREKQLQPVLQKGYRAILSAGWCVFVLNSLSLGILIKLLQ
jgi:hypothetical protein